MANRGASKSTVAREEARNAQIAEMYCDGKTQTQIAKELGISQGRISQIIIEFREEVAARAAVAVADKVAIQTARLDGIFKEAKSAWEASKEYAVTTVVKMALRGGGSKSFKSQAKKVKAKFVKVGSEEKREGQCGNPVYLQVMKNTVDTILRLHNAFPKETTNNNVVIQQFDFSQFMDPIPCETPLQVSPAQEVEKVIARELESQPPNGNGKHH